MAKSLDIKLAEIHADANSKAFILADAKDADMAFGAAAPGKSPEGYSGQSRFRTLEEWREVIRQIVRQGLVDIMLVSASNNEALTIRERLFDGSAVTPAVRANDTTDIHVARGGVYPKQPSLPFRTATIDHIQSGRYNPAPDQRCLGANLGLYSITFNNDAALDRAALEEYRKFRIEAEEKGFRHFLEVFDPNCPKNPIPPEQLGHFINDLVIRTLAGVTAAGRPLFLKIVYHGPRYLEELVRYDRHLVPGILGGGAGTTYDAFKLLHDARKYGARVALYGRKINNAEHQLSFVQFLRMIADGQIGPEEAVKAYHGVLQGLGIRPQRELRDDLAETAQAGSYGGGSGGRTISVPAGYRPVTGPATQRSVGATAAPSAVRSGSDATNGSYPTLPSGLPDFARMTAQQRLDYHRDRLGKTLG